MSQTMRLSVRVLMLLFCVCEGWATAAPYDDSLISRSLAQRYGLQRAWFTQIQLDPARNQVESWSLSYDQLCVVTTAGFVQLIDLTTGGTVWTTQVGNPDYPNLGPGMDADHVAIINGSTLYVLSRKTGRLALQQSLAGAPAASPVVSGGYVYAPLINGRVIGYPLDDPNGYPWFYQSSGRVLVAPLATRDNLFWGTTDGHFYSGGGGRPGIQYRLETPSPFAAPPAFGNDTVYSVTAKGDLFALDPVNGVQKWKFSAGYPAHRSPAVIDSSVFFPSEEPALHALDAATGDVRWTARGVNQFVAATQDHVYSLTPSGRIVILDIRSGAAVARVPTRGANRALINDQNDRLLLLSGDGTLQCLHEVGAQEPTYYVRRPGVTDDQLDAQQATTAEGATTAVEEAAAGVSPADPADLGNPFVDDPMDDAVDVGQPGAEDPFGEFGDQDDPFGEFDAELDDPLGDVGTPGADSDADDESEVENPFL